MDNKSISESLCATCKFGLCLKIARREVIVQTPGVIEEQDEAWKSVSEPMINEAGQAKQFVAEDEMIGGLCFWAVEKYPQVKNIEHVSVQIVKECSRYEKEK